MPRTIRQRLGSAILQRRELVGLTQEEAAAEAKISVRSWRDLEAGKTAANLETIEKVIDGLGWSWSDVLGVLDPKHEDGVAPDDVRRLLDQAWRRSTPREREIALAGLRVLAGGRRARS